MPAKRQKESFQLFSQYATVTNVAIKDNFSYVNTRTIQTEPFQIPMNEKERRRRRKVKKKKEKKSLGKQNSLQEDPSPILTRHRRDI